MTCPPDAAVLAALLQEVEAEKPAPQLGAEGGRRSQWRNRIPDKSPW